MRLSLRWSGRPAPSDQSTQLPLLPWQVRERRFRASRFARPGLDPDEVYAFLDRVAVDLSAIHHALRESRQEAARSREMLRRARPGDAGRCR
ncbi:DivIVA domain-containing protein [Micromonospora sp. WMMD736]|uniref:DivIVA domain-containing protein n=1 Tax=Micromonospora sp. WMMD736 TaxID=3404112 RepID=UPI003B94F753